MQNALNTLTHATSKCFTPKSKCNFKMLQTKIKMKLQSANRKLMCSELKIPRSLVITLKNSITCQMHVFRICTPRHSLTQVIQNAACTMPRNRLVSFHPEPTHETSVATPLPHRVILCLRGTPASPVKQISHAICQSPSTLSNVHVQFKTFLRVLRIFCSSAL